MKRKIKIISTASAASILAFAVLAQDAPESNPDRSNYNQQSLAQPRADRLNGAAKASEIVGMPVRNYEGEKLGKVEDIQVDVESGRIVQVILSTGGFAGIGDTLTAVPPNALHHDVAQKILHLDVDKAKLKGAPKFETTQSDDGMQSNRVAEVYSYYGEQPYFSKPHGNESQSADGKVVSALPRNLEGTINTNSNKFGEKSQNDEIARNTGENNDIGSTRNPDGTWSQDNSSNGNRTNSSWSSLGNVQKTSKLIGTSVKNLQDEKLGDVNNILVDLSSGRIVAVIVSSGGFLGMGDELSAIPPTALRFTPSRDSLQLDASKESLSLAPHFKSNQWPDFNQPSYASGVYRAYNVEPYFTSDATSEADNTRRNVRDRVTNKTPGNINPDNKTPGNTNPDNTARNVRDRDEQSPTPLDQGNSKADIDTTAQIRKEIIAGKNMSVNARNIKIITKDGQIVLRGPVQTAEEKRLIGEIAERSAHSGKVDNQLEVKSNNRSND